MKHQPFKGELLFAKHEGTFQLAIVYKTSDHHAYLYGVVTKQKFKIHKYFRNSFKEIPITEKNLEVFGFKRSGESFLMI